MGKKKIFAILYHRKIFFKALPLSCLLILIIVFHLIFLKESLNLKIALKASLFTLTIISIFQILLWINSKKVFNPRLTWFLLTFIVLLELLIYIPRERLKRFHSFPQVPYIEFLKNCKERFRVYGVWGPMHPNTATGYGVDDFGILQGLFLKRYVFFINAIYIHI